MMWTFETTASGTSILFRARAEGTPGGVDEGLVGDASRVLRPGEEFYGIAYAEYAKHDFGSIEVADDGKTATIVGSGAELRG